MYNVVYENMKNNIAANADLINLTTHNWTSVKNESYIAVATHFINHVCELMTYLIA